jgi:N utilization substance protein A
VVNELRGEKVDIVEWREDPKQFIAEALSPARVRQVILEEDEEGNPVARVIVPDFQLSLAIGKEGQNARLAAKLSGYKVDIKSETEHAGGILEDGASPGEATATTEAPVGDAAPVADVEAVPPTEAPDVSAEAPAEEAPAAEESAPEAEASAEAAVDSDEVAEAEEPGTEDADTDESESDDLVDDEEPAPGS